MTVPTIPAIPLPFTANRSLHNSTVTISPPSMNYWSWSMSNLTGNGSAWNMVPDNVLGSWLLPFIAAYGAVFWAALFGTAALAMFIRQEKVWVPITLTVLGGLPIIVWQLPYDWQKAIGTIVILGIAMIMYRFRKKGA